MSLPRLSFGLVVTFALPLSFHVRGISWNDVGVMRQADIEAALAGELSEQDGTGSRLGRLEDALGVTFTAAPKEADGSVGQPTARYLLHRFFMHRNGWFIRGLEPDGEEWPGEGFADKDREWVPKFLQVLLEKRLGSRGANLRDLAVIAAALEDLVSREARARLNAIYQRRVLAVDTTIHEMDVFQVVDTYYISYLHRVCFDDSNSTDFDTFRAAVLNQFPDFLEAEHWLGALLQPHWNIPGDAEYTFNSVLSMVEAVGQNYMKHYSGKCDSLASALQGLERKLEGRVPLAAFYKKRQHRHWQFVEKVEYLRSIGVLDESNPRSPSVITTNYVTARSNCFHPSHLYAICCKNKCEDLLGHLETTLGQPEATPKAIAEVVAQLPSEFAPAPRRLPARLLARLQEVAKVHGGTVPLHGRLFAQWMHHAYPRECPYPHPKATANPQTPDQWMRSSGHTSTRALIDEVEKVLAADEWFTSFNNASAANGGGSTELPWTGHEELLISDPNAPRRMAPGTQVLDDADAAAPPSSRRDGGGLFALAAFSTPLLMLTLAKLRQKTLVAQVKATYSARAPAKVVGVALAIVARAALDSVLEVASYIAQRITPVQDPCAPSKECMV